MTLTIVLNVSSNVRRSSESAFVQINPAGVTANLVPEGTSMITRGEEQDVQLNPGLYSVDLDEDLFNAAANHSSLSLSLFRSINSIIEFMNILVES